MNGGIYFRRFLILNNKKTGNLIIYILSLIWHRPCIYRGEVSEGEGALQENHLSSTIGLSGLQLLQLSLTNGD